VESAFNRERLPQVRRLLIIGLGSVRK
jgi:hypothetical protein